jgi:saccharopine dehydrogenase-like NADP-dependent oxidoreductase
MKVLALGGCGLMGKHFVRTAIGLVRFSRLTIADRDLAAATQYAASLRHPCVDAVQVDASDQVQLTALLRDYDVVVSTLGPYYLFGTSVLNCAIEARCNYIDICDDPAPTLAMLALHPRAAAAGITALVGFGASPGISNLLAAKAIRAVGQATRVVTTWGSTSVSHENATADTETGSAVDHWVEQLSGTIPVHANGRTVQARPLDKMEIVVPGIGRRAVHTVGHPEPLTLPMTFPSIQDSVNAMVFSRPLIQTLKLMQRRVDSGRQTVAQAAETLRAVMKNSRDVQFDFKESAMLMVSALHERVWSRGYLPVELSAIAESSEDGRRKVAIAWLNGHIPGGMGPNTCIPTAVTLHLLADGHIRQRGVFAPEAVIEPDDFFRRLAPFIRGGRETAPTVVVTTEMA